RRATRARRSRPHSPRASPRRADPMLWAARAAPGSAAAARCAAAVPTRLRSPRAEGDLDAVARAAADVGHGDDLTGLVGVDHRAELLRGRNLLAVGIGEDVAAGRVANAGDRAAAGRAVEAGARGAAAGLDALDGHAGRHAELRGGARRDRLDAHAEERVLRGAARDQLGGDRLHRVRRDREADACVVARVAVDLRRDADHLAAEIEERPARVPVVDRRVGLDRVLDRGVVRRGDLAPEGADDPAGDGVVEPERVADRDDAVADLDLVGVAERDRVEPARQRVDLDHREVRRGVLADERRLVGRAVGERDRDVRGAVDDVLVRDDVPLRVVDEARPLRLGLAGAAERVRLTAARRDVDLDDGIRVPG